MKYFFLFSTLLLLVTSCNSPSEPKPEQVAEAFLTAYYLPDFDQIISLCASGSILQSDMERNALSFNEYPPEIQDKWRKDLTTYNFCVNQVEVNSAKDSAFVTFAIFAPEVPGGIVSRLTLIKEEDEWKVAMLL